MILAAALGAVVLAGWGWGAAGGRSGHVQPEVDDDEDDRELADSIAP
jgi:hypothetical protein